MLPNRDRHLMRLAGKVLAALALVALAGVAAAESGSEPPPAARDLHFGDALFYFYQDDYFTSITRLLSARDRGQLRHHGEESRLLLGGMYLAYGQHRRAGEIFAELLESRDVSVRDRAWFYLARLRYQRGFAEEALAALGSIEQELGRQLEPLRRQLEVQLLMQGRRFAEAASVLEAHEGKGRWAAFTTFNLGVALLHDGRTEEGERVLAKLGARRARGEELRALRDRANLTLAFSLLRRERPDDARAILDRVRLDGPYSNKALLGAAWADIDRNQFRRALVPLEALSSRATKDAAVQEALLAAPYALASLSASRQAAEAYEHAIRAFHAESDRLAGSIDAIRGGALVNALMRDEDPGRMGWFWNLDDVSEAPESRYLYELMADHAFQENLKNYRDLVFLRKNLSDWSRNIGAFDDMLALARRAHAERLPATRTRFAEMDLGAIRSRVESLEARLAQARDSGDPTVLANRGELATLRKLDRLEAYATETSDPTRHNESLDRVRLLRGVVHWQLQTEQSERLWTLTKALRDARSALEEAEVRAGTLSQALDDAPARFGGFGARIDAGHARLLGLSARVDSAIVAQSKLLNESAITLLTERKEVLDAFTVQARFALAAVYDRAAAAGGAP